ncbi:hypothetical protein ACIBG8_08235 [Nonomuraea sp. NPDC050556]|uniref:hypothetical protein n=1 Tax=Nonomuraea sp. NPDC050556 TaxID=3364369 RepID=UPI0037956FC6
MTWIQSARRTGPQRHPDRGNTQLLDATQFGFGPRFLRHFEVVSSEESSVCGQALRRGAPMVVRDVACDPLIAGGPSLGVLLDAGVRNVYSVHRRAADDDPAMDHHLLWPLAQRAAWLLHHAS